jgi:hypothetical protein
VAQLEALARQTLDLLALLTAEQVRTADPDRPRPSPPALARFETRIQRAARFPSPAAPCRSAGE